MSCHLCCNVPFSREPFSLPSALLRMRRDVLAHGQAPPVLSSVESFGSGLQELTIKLKKSKAENRRSGGRRGVCHTEHALCVNFLLSPS